jgi:hypothetical protein
MSLVSTSPQYKAGTKQYDASGVSPQFAFFQTKDSIIPYKFYWDNNSNYPITIVGTATRTSETTGKPLPGDIYGTLFDTGLSQSQIPLVGQDRNYSRFAVTAINSGGKISVGTLDLSSTRWCVVVDKSSGTSQGAKFTIRTTAGNESVCALTTSSTANTWVGGGSLSNPKVVHIFEFKTVGTPGVTHNGTFNPASVTELEFTKDTNTGDVSIHSCYFFESYSMAIGYVNQIMLSCISAASYEETLEQNALVCNQLDEAMITNSRSVSVNFTTKKHLLEQVALLQGDVAQNRNFKINEVICSPDNNPLTISAGTITLPSPTAKILSVEINGKMLYSFHAAASIPEGAFFQNGATVTFNTAYNGKQPTITVETTTSLPSYRVKGLEQLFVGSMYLPMKTENGRIIRRHAKKVQLSLASQNAADDGDELEVAAKFMADDNGNFYIQALQ